MPGNIGWSQWSKWFCEAGAHLTKSGWSKPHTHFKPTNLTLFRHKITLYRFNQWGYAIAGGSNGSRGLSPSSGPLTLTTGWSFCKNQKQYWNLQYTSVVAQDSHFDTIERTLSSALENLSTYHKANQLRDNPRKTQISLFHMHNIHARRSPLTIIRKGTELEYCTTAVYL